MVFGAAINAARDNARMERLDTTLAAELFTSFIYSGYRGLDVELLERRVPRRRTAKPSAKRARKSG
jgi:hypothetical protein